MKKILFITAFLSMTTFLSAQVKNSITGIQLGAFEGLVYNETKLSPTVSLRSQFGYTTLLWGGLSRDKLSFNLSPEFSLEPRWYFTMNNRTKNGKNIKNNSAEFLSLTTIFTPKYLHISNEQNLTYSNGIYAVPSIGIRRNFWGKFNFELKVGYGYGVTFMPKNKNLYRDIFDVRVRFGYDF